MNDTTKILIKTSILNCGIATALINGVISYFTFSQTAYMPSSETAINFMTVAIGCGLICPLFGNITLKGLKKNPTIDLGKKQEHSLARFVPDSVLSGDIVIAIIVTVLLWVMPYLIVSMTGVVFTLSRWQWIVCLGIYSGIVASLSSYFGILRAHYANLKRDYC